MPRQAGEVVERAKAMAPPQHTAAAASSTLCKLLAWDADSLWQEVFCPDVFHVCLWFLSPVHGRAVRAVCCFPLHQAVGSVCIALENTAVLGPKETAMRA